MNKYITTLFLTALLFLSGCVTRSISNSGYRNNPAYRGELSELEVLGVNASKQVSEDDIKKALSHTGTINLRNGASVVLIQSGTQFPDDVMTKEMEKYYRVIPISGIPHRDNRRSMLRAENNESDRVPLDKSLRLAAAKAGAKNLIVYWGNMESAREQHGTKIVSWVPIIGKIIPDENQHMRIRLKAVIMDVATGYWEMMIPEVYEDARTSMKLHRGKSDQIQVSRLKEKAYVRLVSDLQTRFN